MTKTLTIGGNLWFGSSNDRASGRWRMDLLESIDRCGSINQAARDMGMSYKAAWQAVDGMNNLTDAPLVERKVGGQHGGGTRLTERGRELITIYRSMEREFQAFLGRLDQGVADFDRFHEIMRRFGMQTSARNELAGTVRTVTPGAVNTEVVLDLGQGEELVAIVTNVSAETLGLRVGASAYALIKAPWVILTTDESLCSSARNRLCGRVETITEGAVNSEVTLALTSGKRLTAIVTAESVKTLGLREGGNACALIKASHVIIAVNA